MNTILPLAFSLLLLPKFILTFPFEICPPDMRLLNHTNIATLSAPSSNKDEVPIPNSQPPLKLSFGSSSRFEGIPCTAALSLFDKALISIERKKPFHLHDMVPACGEMYGIDDSEGKFRFMVMQYEAEPRKEFTFDVLSQAIGAYRKRVDEGWVKPGRDLVPLPIVSIDRDEVERWTFGYMFLQKMLRGSKEEEEEGGVDVS